MVNLGDIFPDFKADSSDGPVQFHQFIDNTWAILFSHPADYTPVCTTELGRVSQLAGEFKSRGVKMIALSCDDVDSHKGWIKDVNAYSGEGFPYPILADPKRELAVQLGMVDPDEKDAKGLPLTCRAVFIIGPDKRLKLSILYPATTGRNFNEILRVIDSLQLTATKKVATPVDWKKGEDCMVLPSISQDDAVKLFPKGVKVKEVPSEQNATSCPSRRALIGARSSINTCQVNIKIFKKSPTKKKRPSLDLIIAWVCRSSFVHLFSTPTNSSRSSSNKMVNLGDVFPNFKAESSEGPIEFHKFIEGTWAILFSHPADFTPVCTTELGCVAQLDKEFSDRGVKMIALSCDDVQSHKDWIQDVNAYSGKDNFPYPIIADPKREIAVNLGLIDPEEKDSKGLPLTCRSLFIIGPDKRLKLAILYPATTGRNFREVIRVIDSLQLTATKKVATPVDWKVGEECMVLPNISQEEAAKLFPKGVRVKEMPSGKPYLRYTPQPD